MPPLNSMKIIPQNFWYSFSPFVYLLKTADKGSGIENKNFIIKLITSHFNFIFFSVNNSNLINIKKGKEN